MKLNRFLQKLGLVMLVLSTAPVALGAQAERKAVSAAWLQEEADLAKAIRLSEEEAASAELIRTLQEKEAIRAAKRASLQPELKEYEQKAAVAQEEESEEDEEAAELSLALPLSLALADQKRIKDAEICTICQTGFEPGEEVVITKCGHVFHKDCMQGFLKALPAPIDFVDEESGLHYQKPPDATSQVCPICRQEIRKIGRWSRHTNSYNPVNFSKPEFREVIVAE